MNRNSCKFLIGIIFLAVFTVKMGLSIAPLVFTIDKETVNAVIMQLELESQAKDANDSVKDMNKFVKKGADLLHDYQFHLNPLSTDCNLRFYTKARPYINSFYPSVLTPPPNCV
jgi:hypothetical protein